MLCQEFDTDAVVTENKGVTVIRSKHKNSHAVMDTCEGVLNSFTTESVQNCQMNFSCFGIFDKPHDFGPLMPC